MVPRNTFKTKVDISRISLALGLILLAGCTAPGSRLEPSDWMAWKALRLESVAGTNGWTTLIGLHWLNEGENSAGSSPTNDVVLRSNHFPPNLGTFLRRGASVSFASAPEAHVQEAGRAVTKLNLISDPSPHPTQLEIGPVSIIVIDRGERIGLRVRDEKSEARRNFKGLRSFPYDPAWRLAGRFIPYSQPRTLQVPDVTGSFQKFESPGEITFSVRGSECRLAIAIEPEVRDFFIMFRDETAGATTYPAGRFLYVQKPVSGDDVIIDLNRAYTPPCGFTEFATCPLPPRQNHFPFNIEAGELKPVGTHH